MHDDPLADERAEQRAARDHLDAMGDEPDRPTPEELAEDERRRDGTDGDGWTFEDVDRAFAPMAGGSAELDDDTAALSARERGDTAAYDGRRDERTLERIRDAVTRADEVLDAIDAVPVAGTRAAAHAQRDQRLAVLERALDAIHVELDRDADARTDAVLDAIDAA